MSNDMERLERLEEAIALGATSVTHRNKTVHYRSINDMMRIRDMLHTRIYGNQKGKGKIYAPAFDRGYR